MQILAIFTPPPNEPVYDVVPCKVALYPFPVASVQVVPDVGAVWKLNCNPLVTNDDGGDDIKNPFENIIAIFY